MIAQLFGWRSCLSSKNIAVVQGVLGLRRVLGNVLARGGVLPRWFEDCPPELCQLIQGCLVWHAPYRITAADAKNSSFLKPPGERPLRISMDNQLAKYGYATLAQQELDPDLLCYLQQCSSWNSLAVDHVQQRAKVSGCIAAEEAALCLKTEIPGFVDEENPPKCRSLNSDKDLQPILWALGRFRASRWLGRRRALHPGIAALSPGAISLAPIIPAVGAAASAITSGP